MDYERTPETRNGIVVDDFYRADDDVRRAPGGIQ